VPSGSINPRAAILSRESASVTTMAAITSAPRWSFTKRGRSNQRVAYERSILQ